MPGRHIWTNAEVTYLRAHIDDDVTDLALALRLGPSQVRAKRHKIRKQLGLTVAKTTPLRRATNDDLTFIRENYSSMSRTQMAAALGATTSWVAKGIWKLGLVDDNVADGRQRNPFDAGPRTVLARTCRRCGKFKEARHFGHRVIERTGGNLHGTRSVCLSCDRTMNKTRYLQQRPVAQRRSRDWFDKMQAVTAPYATRSGMQYSNDDDVILQDTTVPLLLAALKINRSYASVSGRAQRLGVVRSKKTRGSIDADKNWVIIFDKIGVERALELEASGKLDPTGIPTEADWDWND